MPALTVIDRDGKIRLMHYADSPGDIPADEENLSLLDALITEEGNTNDSSIAESK